MSILNELSIFPENHAQLQTAIEQIKSEIEGGNLNPLKVKAQLQYLQLMIDGVKEAVNAAARDEVEKYGKNEPCKMYGFSFQIRETGTTYNYDKCNDPKLNTYIEKQEIIKRDLQARQKFLQSLSAMETIVDEETGGVFTIFPPEKKSTTSVVLTPIKNEQIL